MQLTRTRVADHFADAPSGHVLAALREPLFVVAVQESEARVAVDVGHACRHVVHDEAQLGFARTQRLLGLLQPVDVVHEHECAAHFA